MESRRDEVHASEMLKTKEQLINISVFKIDVPPIIGGLGEGYLSTTPLTSIKNSEFWNAHDGVRGVYLCASK